MNLVEIQAAVDTGMAVRWKNDGYRVHSDGFAGHLITFQSNNFSVGLASRSGVLLGEPKDFYIAAETELWENTYWCECGEKWQSELDSQCDDRCPSCDSSISPMFSSLVVR